MYTRPKRLKHCIIRLSGNKRVQHRKMLLRRINSSNDSYPVVLKSLNPRTLLFKNRSRLNTCINLGTSQKGYRQYAILIVVIVVILAGSTLLLQLIPANESSTNDNGRNDDTPVQPGPLAPDFSMPDLTGTLFQLVETRGQIVVIDFMATWCGPCRAAMPQLGVIWEQYNDTIAMISIDIDPVESEDTLQRYADEFPYATWRWAKDTVNVAQLYQITAIPTTVIIDQDGTIRFRHIGVVEASAMRQEIEQLLQ